MTTTLKLTDRNAETAGVDRVVAERHKAGLAPSAVRPIDAETSGLTQRRYRVRSALMEAFLGFGFGFFVLHPVTMAVFGWLGDHPAAGSPELGAKLVQATFTIGMLPMGVVFGLFGMVIGAMDGYHRSVMRLHRDRLAEELDLTQAFRTELEVRNQRLHELEMETFIHSFLDVEHLPMPEAYLEKPVDADELLRVTGEAIGAGSLRSQRTTFQ